MNETDKKKAEALQTGETIKSAELKGLTINDAELEQINKHTLERLTADDVFIFKALITQNTTDRDFEWFSEEAVKDMATEFVGKPLLTDHSWNVNSQLGRVYKTELIESDEITEHGENLTKLVAHVYILRSEKTADIIREISAGIKKEVSIGVQTEVLECGICGVDNKKKFCEHFWGREYDGKIATFKLDGLKEAFELSLVSVPAMAAAGAIKRSGGQIHKAEKENALEAEKESKAAIRYRLLQQKIKSK